MIYREHHPEGRLGELVDRFWYCEGMVTPHPFERVMPSGCASLIFALAQDWISVPRAPRLDRVERGPASLFVPARAESELVATADFARLAGVHFHPWGWRAFFAEPARVLGTEDLPLEALWGTAAREIRARLGESRHPEEVFRVLESALQGRLREVREMPALVHAARRMGTANGPASVAKVAMELGYSERHFSRMFLDHVGLTPKRFQRVRRFRRAVACAVKGVAPDWANLAADCGFADQSHFVREFQAFSGVNPTAYLAGQRRWDGHLAVDETNSESTG
jgi:AraC-like DNA-binding protein